MKQEAAACCQLLRYAMPLNWADRECRTKYHASCLKETFWKVGLALHLANCRVSTTKQNQKQNQTKTKTKNKTKHKQFKSMYTENGIWKAFLHSQGQWPFQVLVQNHLLTTHLKSLFGHYPRRLSQMTLKDQERDGLLPACFPQLQSVMQVNIIQKVIEGRNSRERQTAIECTPVRVMPDNLSLTPPSLCFLVTATHIYTRSDTKFSCATINPRQRKQ